MSESKDFLRTFSATNTSSSVGAKSYFLIILPPQILFERAVILVRHVVDRPAIIRLYEFDLVDGGIGIDTGFGKSEYRLYVCGSCPFKTRHDPQRVSHGEV